MQKMKPINAQKKCCIEVCGGENAPILMLPPLAVSRSCSYSHCYSHILAVSVSACACSGIITRQVRNDIDAFVLSSSAGVRLYAEDTYMIQFIVILPSPRGHNSMILAI
jgi:hypothetical protein